jgi:nucleotide-binding universal stress UspA family protein
VTLAAYFVDIETSAEQGMETYQKRMEEKGVAADTMIVHGTPFHEIIETAKTKQVDLIVMGTHGRTGLQHLLIGSVAERVVRLAPCPVMVTRETRHQAAA